ncbi:MAG: type VI secretion system tube protein Hcp [Candidatus Acidiferrales bacterium]
MTGRTSSIPAVSEGVAPAPTPAKPAQKTAAPAVQRPPAVAYLLLESAQGPVNGEATDAMHRNWIAVSSIDKGSISDGAAKGQASDGMDQKRKDGDHSGNNPLYESKESMDHKNISDGAAKSQAVDAMAQDKNVSDGAAKAQSPDAVAPGIPALDASAKDAAKMDAASGASSGSHNGSFTVTKEIDKATPMLRQASVSGNRFPSAQLDVLDGGVWHHYQLTDVTVTSTQNAGGGSLPSENISFNYAKIETK